ncbi:MAG: ComF family protein [Candidatus Melainabacteria bacterium]|nr:ComF family protein [Candidatus Melainabacteria bacterium]
MKALDLIFENSCLICNESSNNLLVCNKCENDFTEREKNHTKHFEEITVFSWGLYDGKLRDGILNLKAGKKKLATYFTNRLTKFWNNISQQIKNNDYLIIPVPSHKKRIEERGYCQSSLIAKGFARNIGKEFSAQVVIRNKETKYMNSLNNINERAANIKNAFTLINSIKKEKCILIIDDILTSGSTMCELARTIHRNYSEISLLGLTIASGDRYD